MLTTQAQRAEEARKQRTASLSSPDTPRPLSASAFPDTLPGTEYGPDRGIRLSAVWLMHDPAYPESLPGAISEQSEALLQEAAKHAAEFGRSEVDTEHLLLALADSDVVKTILGQFKIKVDDLKRQIESEAKRGDKPFEGEIGVSPRVKDALSRAFVASNELGHSYVGPEHFLIGLAEGNTVD